VSYEYKFENERAGDLRLPAARYRMVHEGFKLLRSELDIWNNRALEHGASDRPYAAEVDDLARMIDWGDEELSHKRPDVVVKEASIGTVRYVKAALMILIRKKEEDYASKLEAEWPDKALKALRDSVEPMRRMADSINYEPSEVLWQLIRKPGVVHASDGERAMEWDIFISHASEDKDSFVRPLARALSACGLKVWLDEFTLTVGDSLRRSIDRGLAGSRFGIVVISPDFLRKEWPQRELDGLAAREADGLKVILPVWHNISREQILAYSPTLADRVAASSDRGLEHVVSELLRAIKPHLKL